MIENHPQEWTISEYRSYTVKKVTQVNIIKTQGLESRDNQC